MTPTTPSLWRTQRTIGPAYGMRRAAAAYVSAWTTRSRRLWWTWLVTLAATFVLVVGIGWAVRTVAPAHNPTLTWATGIGLGVLAALGFVSSAMNLPSDARFRRGAAAVAVLNARVFAVRVESGRPVGLHSADIGQVRWVCGVACIQNGRTRTWLAVPAELFPRRDEWRDLRQQLLSGESPLSSLPE